jgi:hypothetical protein
MPAGRPTTHEVIKSLNPQIVARSVEELKIDNKNKTYAPIKMTMRNGNLQPLAENRKGMKKNTYIS